MKNLIAVTGKFMKSVSSKFTSNKIKVGVICILAINGIVGSVHAGNIVSNENNTPEIGVTEPARAIVEINPQAFIPKIIANIVTSGYGTRNHPVSGKRKQHKGLDLSFPSGTPIHAPANGIVAFSGWKRGYGYVVEIDHENGYVSLFAHNKINLVKVGDIVTAATIIAKVGMTGVATGPHIHLEIIFHGKNVNPISFLGH